MNTRFKLAAALSIATSLTAFADVKINDSLTVGGYAAGSYRTTDTEPGTTTDRFDLDAAKLLFAGTFKPVTGTLSLYYSPGAPSEVTVLDAYATVDVGGGGSITAGKFLSYMGYEAFDIPNMSQITYANGDFLAPIPGYHTGIRYDFSSDAVGFGAAVVDSVYSGPNYLKGDGELRHNAGFELYAAYKGIKNLTLWGGLAYDTGGNVINPAEEITMWDFWASYNISSTATIAGEYAFKDGGPANKGYNWLVFYNQVFSPKWSTAFRVSGEDLDNGGPEFMKYTISPTYKVNDNFSVRGEYSYQNYDKAPADKSTFVGIQAILKF